jgi:hypothetical protein
MERSAAAEPDTSDLLLGGDGEAQTPDATGATKEPGKETAPSESTQGLLCPRCGSKLVSPDGLGWCPKCGYCRSLAEDGAKIGLATATVAQKTSPLGVLEFYELLAKLPPWLCVLLGGAAGLAVLSLIAHLLLPVDSLARALWSTLELVLGLLALFAAQVWSLIVLAPRDDGLSARDLVLSVRLWGLTFRKLPEMRRQVWVGGWGVAAALCSVLIVGGFSYWYQFYKPKKLADKSLLAAIRDAAQGKEKISSLVESVQDFADKQDLTKQKEDKNKPKPDKRPTVQCAVIGYVVEKDKTLSGLVLATLEGDKLRYAGVVQRGFSPEESKELLQRLAPLVRTTPFLPNVRISAIWVNPEIFCEVHQSGYDEAGHLKDPSFYALLDIK